MLPDIQPGNTKILYFFNCLLDGMHTIQTAATKVTNIGNRLSLLASVSLGKSGFMIFFLVIRYHGFSLMFAKSAVNQFPYDVINNRKQWNSDNHTDNSPHSAK